MKLRPIILGLHRYAGVISGLILILLGLSGSLLIIPEQLEGFLYPHLVKVIPQEEVLTAGEVVGIVESKYPDSQPYRITMPSSPDRSYTVMIKYADDKLVNIYVNPYGGKILGSLPWEKSVIGWLIDLHVHLFFGKWGAILVGITGGIFVLMGITGLALWNGWRRLSRGLQIRWHSNKYLITYDLHKFTGVISVGLLVLIAISGTAMIFWDSFEAFVYFITQESQPLESVSRINPGLRTMSVDALLQKAQATLSEGSIYKFFPPKTPEATFEVWMKVVGYFNPYPIIYLDQYTGEVINIEGWTNESLSNSLLNMPYILHTGIYGGLEVRTIYFLIGLSPAFLLLTGLVLFRRNIGFLWRKFKT